MVVNRPAASPDPQGCPVYDVLALLEYLASGVQIFFTFLVGNVSTTVGPRCSDMFSCCGFPFPWSSVADPDPSDPYVSGPPGSGSGSTTQMYGSGSFYHYAKIVRKILIPSVLWLLFNFLSFRNYVNVPLKSNKQKNFKLHQNICFLLASWRSMTKIAGSGSISQRHGSAGSGSTPKCHGSGTLLRGPGCGVRMCFNFPSLWRPCCSVIVYLRGKYCKQVVWEIE